MTFTYVTITHTFETAADTAAAGFVDFKPVAPMHNGLTVVQKTVSAPLSGLGGLSQILAANTDPGTIPTGTTYQVTERITGQPTLTYFIQVPHDQGTSLDLRVLAGWVGGTTGGGGTGTVSSINGEAPDGTGNIVLAASDVGAQPADADLTELAALADGYPRRASGTWGQRTAQQLADDIGAVTSPALGTVYATHPPTGLTAVTADGTTNDATALQAQLTYVKNTYGGGTVNVSAPGKTIKCNSGITVPRGVRLVSDPSTVLNFSGIGSTAAAITVDDDDFVPLVGVTLVGPAGDPRDTPTNTTHTSVGIKVNGVRLDFHDIRITSFGRGVDLTANDTFSVSFVGGGIDKCYVCIYADQIAASAIENGEGFTFERFTLYNSVRAFRICGNGISFFFEKCRIDYHLTDFGVIEDSWVYFTDCHMETTGCTSDFLFDVDKNSHVYVTACHILMGTSSFLFNPSKGPWNNGYGNALLTNTDIFCLDPSSNAGEHYSSALREFPANTTTMTLFTPYPVRWCPMSAEFVASDFRAQPNFDQVRVDLGNASLGTVTLTASASSTDIRFVRIRY